MTHGKDEAVPPAQRWPTFWRRFAIYVALGLLCAYFAEWLPVAEGGKRVLTRVWGPVLTASYPTTGRDQITVMLIDDQDLHDYGEAWPVSLGFHQRRLLELLKYKPKAVLFDIVFLDDRKDPELDSFVTAACTARSAGVPVFIGSFGPGSGAPSRTEAAMLARTVNVDGVARPCIEPAYMNLKIDGFDQSVWEYDVLVPPAGKEHGAHDNAAAHAGDGAHGAATGPGLPSPAARLYQVDHVLPAHAAAEPLALVWGTASDPGNLEWVNSDVRPGGAGALCTASWQWHRVLPVGKVGPPICPYQQLLPLRTLNRHNGLDAAGLQTAIGGKYIIYGTQLQSTADTIVSPFHGRIAGAFLHAMALDNLLSFQGMPKQAGEFGRPWASHASGFIAFAVLVISALVAGRVFFPLAPTAPSAQWRRLFAADPPAGPHRAARPGARAGFWRTLGSQCRRAGKALGRALLPRLWVALFLAAVIAVMIGVSYYWLDLGPLVWIEYALFPIAAEFVHLGEKCEGWMLAAWRYAGSVREAFGNGGNGGDIGEEAPAEQASAATVRRSGTF